jgi:hypothetical protein
VRYRTASERERSAKSLAGCSLEVIPSAMTSEDLVMKGVTPFEHALRMMPDSSSVNPKLQRNWYEVCMTYCTNLLNLVFVRLSLLPLATIVVVIIAL